MVRLWLVIVVAAVAFTVFALIDCATMPRTRVRSLRKGIWVLLVVVLPVLGGVLWFLLGRTPAVPRGNGGGGAGYRGPEDDPDFLGGTTPPGRKSDDKDQDDATLRSLEDQFHDGDDDGRPDR
ncbi:MULTISPECIES: PLDc N-terminal domain-containing protein [Curtobacterium]|uniref:PLDc N-terminal domain-containing protein n=1 Tax=Curtobacterium TaxID=2034 RepID=UPI000DAA1CF1|nr:MULTISPECIES: PLDc N-terminal domain-containing protein [Curtobacterium]MBY0176635.1 PLDc N-terminal domain-containing protein [Curtobacterium herbarum]MDY1004825.1 PLDc N-terminal domain-containing protein [Curtobacterium sp. CFBP9011]WIE60443.1 PLDc N-terminal domain-containing protein [Curtobacterium sp. MCLR17_032]